MSVAFDVSKSSTPEMVAAHVSANMPDMSVTFAVENPLTSIDERGRPSNRWDMSVTRDVSSPDRSSVPESESSPENRWLMLVARRRFRLESPAMDAQAAMPSNQ